MREADVVAVRFGLFVVHSFCNSIAQLSSLWSL